MNFYDFHIGDYASRTSHLEPMEDLAYRRLLDLYYVREGSLPQDVKEIARLVRLRGQEGTIEAILAEFFVKGEAGWTHERCESVIAAAVDKRNKARAAAALRWGNADAMPPDSGRSADAKPTQSGGNAPSPSPTTQSHKKPPKSPKGEPEGFEEFYAAYPKKVARVKAAKAFASVTVPVPILLAALSWQRNLPDWKKENGKYIPLPATWLNDKRWEDEKGAEAEAAEWHQSRSGVEGKAKQLGLAPWNENVEHWPTFKQRVMKAERSANPGMTLEQLMRLAPKQGVAA